MKFKAKIFKLGNSVAVYLPKSIYGGLEIGKEYELEVYTNGDTGPKPVSDVYISNFSDKIESIPLKEKFNTQWCSKHTTMKGNCKCK